MISESQSPVASLEGGPGICCPSGGYFVSCAETAKVSRRIDMYRMEWHPLKGIVYLGGNRGNRGQYPQIPIEGHSADRPPSIVDVVQHLLEVFPCLALGVLVVGAQQVRGMIRHHHGNLLPLEPLAAHLGDTFLVAGEGARGGAAEGADHLGADHR